jgi:hypothetical protein
MTMQTSRYGKTKRIGKAITLSPLSRLLLERESLERNMSHSRIVEELIVKHCPGLIAKEEAAIRDLTLELEAKRKKICPPFKV